MEATERTRAKIERYTQRLAQLRAREIILEQKEATKAAQARRKIELSQKIQLGQLIIAAGAEKMPGTEIVGALLAYRENVVATAEREQHRQRGAAHLARATARSSATAH